MWCLDYLLIGDGCGLGCWIDRLCYGDRMWVVLYIVVYYIILCYVVLYCIVLWVGHAVLLWGFCCCLDRRVVVVLVGGVLCDCCVLLFCCLCPSRVCGF